MADIDERDRKRLSPLDRSKDLLPFRRAEKLSKQSLYWLAVSALPMAEGARKWILEFLKRLEEHLDKEHKLRPESFLDFKSLVKLSDMKDAFMRTAMEYRPHLGLARRPGEDVTFPEPPSEEDVYAFGDGSKKFDMAEYVADYMYWFLDKAAVAQRELFFGHGGMTSLYIAPDPATEAPEMAFTPGMLKHPMFKQFDVKRIHQQTFSLQDGFLNKSKELFGEDIKNDPQYPGMLFILPLLETRHFFGADEETVEKWYSLFDVYIRESMLDKGVLIASKHELDEAFIEILKAMREEGWVYPVA